MARRGNAMERAQLEEFVASAALLAAHLTRQCETSIADQRSAADALQRSADAVGKGVLDGHAGLRHQARLAIRQALSDEIPAASRALQDSAGRLQALVEQLRREQDGAALRMRLLGWKALGALALAGLTIVGATGYTAAYNLRRAEQGQVRAEVLQALQHVAITSCDGHPCLRLEEGMARWPKNDEYVLVHRDGAAGDAQASAP